MTYRFSTCEASSKLSYINLMFGCSVLLFTLLYNNQLPFITDLLACWLVLSTINTEIFADRVSMEVMQSPPSARLHF